MSSTNETGVSGTVWIVFAADLQDISVAVNTADAAMAVVRLVLFFCGLVAFVQAGLLLGLGRVGHEVDELLQRRTEFPLLVFLQTEVQSLVDHDAQRLNDLQGKNAAAPQECVTYSSPGFIYSAEISCFPRVRSGFSVSQYKTVTLRCWAHVSPIGCMSQSSIILVTFLSF